MTDRTPESRPLWTWALLALAAPLTTALCVTLWRMPFPLSEAVALFEDVADRRVAEFFVPTTSYYRPFFYAALSAIWHGSSSIASALSLIRLLHIVPLLALVVLFIRAVRVRTLSEMAVATVGLGVLLGSPGLLGNLELPLSYTIVGMPLALCAWVVAEGERRWWSGAVIVAVTIVAIGFKEQGLVIVPVVIAAWWMGSPGIGRTTALVVAVLAVAYVGFRAVTHPAGAPMFEQDIGYGFGVISTSDATRRFGASPLWIYAYNGASTVANLLCAEPADGVFRITAAVEGGRTQPWHWVYLLSSLGSTCLIGWWGIGTLRTPASRRSHEARLFVVTMLAVLACGALSFDYSRARLGGMAVPFYALAAYAAARAALQRADATRLWTAASVATLLLLLSLGWQLRAMYTLEFTRQRAVNAQREWLTSIGRRRVEFAGRSTYLRIMNGMLSQGTATIDVRPTRYPRWLTQLMGED